ncbi:MAG TPA: four-carbon acid sugar kinase family protein [Sedimentibacter sp.]|nr:four-carbon acid sugar kinase family protein [Sedimentibacter sp.]
MMSKIIIIADDLTGANATGVLLVQQGFKAATFINLDKYNSLQNDDYDIVTINTDSRAIKREEAYKRVKSIVEFFKDEDVTLFSKRIDSTFRGNIGAEISAILDNVKDDTYAIVVPSFPASGRTCVGGYLMVHQVPLEKTPVATDPKTPVLTSKVVNLLEEQMQEKIGYVELGKVLKGTDSIKNSIIDQIGKGYRIIVVDATTNDDIINIARAVKNTGLSVISADPGPFTAALSAELLDIPEGEKGKKVLMTIGSISGLTKKQLDEFKMEYKTFIVEVNASNLLYKETKEKEINEAVDKLLSRLSEFEVIGVTTLSEDNILDLRMIAKEEKISEDEVSQKISGGLAEITVKTLEKSNSLLRGLYISGGDVTVAVCNALGAAAIEVKDEVLPLAVYGRIIDGTYHNMPIITKGGLVGDEKAIIKCVNYMFTKLSNDYHTIKR